MRAWNSPEAIAIFFYYVWFTYFLCTANNIEISITVQPGNFRSCGTLSIPDNLCLDKNDEYQIAFSVLTPIENATIIFERDTAWLFIIDDDSKFIY